MNLSAYQTIWSPNGKAIAFTYFNVDNSYIYSVNTDGSKLRNITNHKAMTIFPDGHPMEKKLYFNHREISLTPVSTEKMRSL